MDSDGVARLFDFEWVSKTKYFWVVPTALDFFDFEGVSKTKYFCLSYPIKNIFNISIFWFFVLDSLSKTFFGFFVFLFL